MLRIHEENHFSRWMSWSRAGGRRAMRRQNKFHFCFWPFSSILADGLRFQCQQKYREFIALVNGSTCVWVGGLRLYRTLINRKLNSRASENLKIISLLICFHRVNGTDPFKTYKNKREAVKYVLTARTLSACAWRRWMTRKWIWWACQYVTLRFPILMIIFFFRVTLFNHCYRIFKAVEDGGGELSYRENLLKFQVLLFLYFAPLSFAAGKCEYSVFTHHIEYRKWPSFYRSEICTTY